MYGVQVVSYRLAGGTDSCVPGLFETSSLVTHARLLSHDGPLRLSVHTPASPAFESMRGAGGLHTGRAWQPWTEILGMAASNCLRVS